MQHRHIAIGFQFGFETVSMYSDPPFGWRLYLEVYYPWRGFSMCRRTALWTHIFKPVVIV